MKQQVVVEWLEQGVPINILLFCISSFLFVFLVIKLKKKDGGSSSKYMNLPPSPSKLPLIGNLHQLVGLPHHTLSALSQKYGPIMLLYLGRVPTLVVSSADAAHDVMKTYDHVFSSRPLLLFPNRLTYYSKDILLAPYGDYWRQVRKMCVMQLLNAKKVQSTRFVREEEVALMMETIKAASTSSLVVNLSQTFVALTNNIICRAVFGRKYIEKDGRRSLQVIIDELAYLFGVPNVADFIPSLAWVNRLNGLNAKVEKNFNELDSIIDEMIEEHLEKRRGGVSKVNAEEEDFVDVLIRNMEEETSGVQLGRDNIKAIVQDMFVAGTHTSAVTMEWAMSELIAQPKIMEEVQKEVRGIAKGKQTLTESDTINMHYLKLVIKETLRMHPPGPLLAPHQSMEKVQIQGYDIPPNTTVMINVYAIGRDPKLWEEPNVFNPKRFSEGSISAEVDFKGQHFQLIPFGSGRRGCPGIGFAMAQVELALANILNSFDWELPDGMSPKDLDMEEDEAITVGRKNDLILSVKAH